MSVEVESHHGRLPQTVLPWHLLFRLASMPGEKNTHYPHWITSPLLIKCLSAQYIPLPVHSSRFYVTQKRVRPAASAQHASPNMDRLIRHSKTTANLIRLYPFTLQWPQIRPWGLRVAGQCRRWCALCPALSYSWLFPSLQSSLWVPMHSATVPVWISASLPKVFI